MAVSESCGNCGEVKAVKHVRLEGTPYELKMCSTCIAKTGAKVVK